MKTMPEEMTPSIMDLLISVESNLNKCSLMALSINSYFDKEAPTEKDFHRIIAEFANITTMTEILDDALYESRNAIAGVLGTNVRGLVG